MTPVGCGFPVLSNRANDVILGLAALEHVDPGAVTRVAVLLEEVAVDELAGRAEHGQAGSTASFDRSNEADSPSPAAPRPGART
jgi:hypothetical protein